MISFKGGLTYGELINMPIPEVLEWLSRAEKIDREIQKQYDSISKGRN